MLVRTRITGSTEGDVVMIDSRYVWKVNELIPNFRMYPRSFFGPVLRDQNQTIPNPVANVQLAGGTMSASVKENISYPLPHPVIEQMFIEADKNDMYFTDIDNQIKLIAFIKSVMPDHDLTKWVQLQMNSPATSSQHLDFMRFMFHVFPRTGRMSMPFNVWRSLLTIDFNRAFKDSVANQHKDFANEILTEFTTVEHFIDHTTNQTDGWNMLLRMMHTLYGA